MSETAWGTRLDRRACATGVTAPGATRRGNPTRRAGREAPPRRETATRPDRPPPTVFPTNASDCMMAVVRRAREEARLGVKRSLREGCDGRVCLNANQRTLRTWSRPCVCLGTHPTSASPGGERCRNRRRRERKRSRCRDAGRTTRATFSRTADESSNFSRSLPRDKEPWNGDPRHRVRFSESEKFLLFGLRTV